MVRTPEEEAEHKTVPPPPYSSTRWQAVVVGTAHAMQDRAPPGKARS
ncbi:MAG TPA: hypothetical protein PKK74_02530 [Candidatus Methanoculleus thermohydrogenotrophicum]|nr:hypothetical protein [Candidatus Methanoculleus thermohydrogenotrophicum]NLM81816.1 hypothetical protein [Candidatus Methanoculleus thermohydrogenotrophicum]HOB17560.1 hypothetical protein [Candidatus Methanoculleus thermohydrogenotrophicum]HPZ37716.1 hypothetical protein [Candidatus Methanoculleus thermohydrogenotrophicum]HQC90819.1 hypothetical protein [Candidatus Methanoculleus thermohydrogenotrophicum]